MDNNSNKKDVWIPTPRYLCRKDVVLSFLDDVERGSFLEVGIGSGDLILDMVKREYIGLGIDISDDAVEMVRKKVKDIDCKIRVENIDLFNITESFDIVIALEVIEHIKDDLGALKKIYNILNVNGYLIVSVPAHKKDWDINDEWAGHFRRYEKDEL
ncbi:MAG: class I SAM-dependent methyltransferase, partial [Candidatus Pacebacteria bacterium]|nr:class I SAM-dependent methyltransferase [Candidatus Paceibacterota bacterium]